MDARKRKRLEAADPSVSLDLLLRAYFLTGARSAISANC